MVTNDQVARYKAIVAKAGDNQEVINQVYKGAVTQMAELQLMAALEGDKKDMITDLIIITEIVEMTADVFNKTVDQVIEDMLLATEMLPIDDIQAAFEMKQKGMLN